MTETAIENHLDISPTAKQIINISRENKTRIKYGDVP